MGERLILLLAGAALGALTLSAFERLQKSTAPSAPSSVIVSIPATPPVPAGLAKSVNKFEVAKEIMPYGFPGPVSDILYRSAYVASYNRRDRNPNWVAEHLTNSTGGGGDRGKSQFKEDESIPPQFRARLLDYFKSGFDRGHMAPAADVTGGQEAMDETFYLTNIAPQVGEGFNRDYWAHFESFCRRLTKTFPDVYILTGPLYLPRQDPVDHKWYVRYQVIGNPPNVAVPTHFYKVILAVRDGQYSLAAFVLPNARISNDTPLEQFQVPLDAVERAAGMVFFDKVPVPGGDRSKLKDLCKETKCQLMAHKFMEERKLIRTGP
ncbi:hypothetical protein BC937DRAFT_86399 [Endogone sp. FLAS-F59071]|nr:hypothetical protein BC937DRAFT_86399 [Endogone sp. FLAS-F59071]|eukprot:RUS20084.1 hypothetical protein BC937DRAFT_86399 [Endogone sp. FLAS-F59071]